MNFFNLFGGEGGGVDPRIKRSEANEEYVPPVPKEVEKPNLGLEAVKRGISNVTSWDEIHKFDMKYFEEELRKIYGLEPEQDVEEEATRRAEDGFPFTLDIIAEYYGLPPGSSFEEISEKKNSQK